MVRRFPTQVHKQVARLLQANYIAEPSWYQPVLDFPPLPLPPKAPPPRTKYDLPPEVHSFSATSTTSASLRPKKVQPAPVHYIEDDVRRQFFRDHPFESFRPVSIVEGGDIQDEHPIKGKAWTRLRQRGRNPSPEDAVRYAVNLYHFHDVPLTEAYARSVAQFRSLRAEHQIATTFAVMEAHTLGAAFGPSEVEQAFTKEVKSLDTWKEVAETDEGAAVARKRWKLIAESKSAAKHWTRAQEYVRQRQDGMRPSYELGAEKHVDLAPVLSREQIVAQSSDYMTISR